MVDWLASRVAGCVGFCGFAHCLRLGHARRTCHADAGASVPGVSLDVIGEREGLHGPKSEKAVEQIVLKKSRKKNFEKNWRAVFAIVAVKNAHAYRDSCVCCFWPDLQFLCFRRTLHT
ncbi:MAG: hypothetical protein LBV54_03585 [Puniceicoccales bacterium]|jgi:hypothetical protein|nr:hypothetical protein [Puniceicoccales bacterium]